MTRDLYKMKQHLSIAFLLITLAINSSCVKSRTEQHITKSNWDQITKGKTLFLKFCSKSCAHCQDMRIAWEIIEEEWEDDPNSIIGTIDCDINTKFCEEFDINGTPTILYGDRNQLQEYAGDKSFAKMKRFAKGVLVPTCSPENLDACNDEDRGRIHSWVSMSTTEVEEMIEEWKEKEIDAQKTFDAEMAKLQVVYDEMNSQHVRTKAVIQDRITFLRALLERKTIM